MPKVVNFANEICSVHIQLRSTNVKSWSNYEVFFCVIVNHFLKHIHPTFAENVRKLTPPALTFSSTKARIACTRPMREGKI